MRNEQTSIHLLLASIVTMFGVMLILVDLAMSWELWMVPVILVGNTLVWILHIGRTGSETFYENLCAGLLMVGFFFFGVHRISLYDMPAVACMLILVFSMFDRRRLLYMTAGLYLVVLLYHGLVLGTITWDMGAQELVRLGFGATVVTGSMMIARYRINRRRENRKRYDRTLVELEKAGRQNAEFLSNVSHELKTPIALIQGYAEGLKEGINDDAESREYYCEVIMDEASKMNQMVKKLLTLNQMEFGNDMVTMERFDITELIGTYLQSAAILCRQKGINLQMEDCPPVNVWADEFMVEEVFGNYFSNAINHVAGKRVIDVKLTLEEKKVRVSVFNTGAQIPEESLPHIWEKFYKVDKARTREYGGSGVGLSIVKAAMEAMNQRYGAINYDNGVEFWFELEAE